LVFNDGLYSYMWTWWTMLYTACCRIDHSYRKTWYILTLLTYFTYNAVIQHVDIDIDINMLYSKVSYMSFYRERHCRSTVDRRVNCYSYMSIVDSYSNVVLFNTPSFPCVRFPWLFSEFQLNCLNAQRMKKLKWFEWILKL
jgi:hypothetical protein